MRTIYTLDTTVEQLPNRFRTRFIDGEDRAVTIYKNLGKKNECRLHIPSIGLVETIEKDLTLGQIIDYANGFIYYEVEY